MLSLRSLFIGWNGRTTSIPGKIRLAVLAMRFLKKCAKLSRHWFSSGHIPSS
jgi:hypothetical protein